MKENNISRRAFFRHATNKILPILGVLFVGYTPIIEAATKLPTMSCQGNCWGKCEDSCNDSCSRVCRISCFSQCDSGCKGGCFDKCAIGCSGTCRGTCELSCIYVSWNVGL